MKYIKCNFREFRSLESLADKAKMYWWFEKTGKSKTVDDLDDLSCAILFENLERMKLDDVMLCYEVFARYDAIKDFERKELKKYFERRR